MRMGFDPRIGLVAGSGIVGVQHFDRHRFFHIGTVVVSEATENVVRNLERVPGVSVTGYADLKF